MGPKQKAFLEESTASVGVSTPDSICVAATSGKGGTWLVPVALKVQWPCWLHTKGLVGRLPSPGPQEAVRGRCGVGISGHRNEASRGGPTPRTNDGADPLQARATFPKYSSLHALFFLKWKEDSSAGHGFLDFLLALALPTTRVPGFSGTASGTHTKQAPILAH